MEYQNVRLVQARRKKVLMLSLIISIFVHMLLFFAFRIKFLGYKTVKVSKVMRVRRVNIPPGRRPGPLSASSARKRAKPKPVTRKNLAKKKPAKRRKKIKSKMKVASKREEKRREEMEQQMALEQKEAEYDVLSMIEGDMIVPGGGNLGDDPDAYGLNYEDDMVFEYGEGEESMEYASIEPDKFLGTMATPIVVSKPYTSIGESFTDIPYPDEVKIKKEKLKSGICRVYLRLSISPRGEIYDIFVRSPKTEEDKVKYKIFLDTVIDTVNTWSFDHTAATVFVDVRFTIK